MSCWISRRATVPSSLKLYSLDWGTSYERGQRHLNEFYFGLDDLWKNRFDGVIVTGTEPHHQNLKDEPYWNLLTGLFDWAERNSSSTILSCLAAHASVLHSHGIPRQPLADKMFGVFEATTSGNHRLMTHAAGSVRFPHSRWNEVRRMI